MKLNIDANVIKSPLQSEFVIADRIQLETDSLSIMLNAIDVNIPINNANTGLFTKFNYEGRQKEGNWMAYWVGVKAKDLIELYPHVHAHQPGMVRNQTPYDFQLTIGQGIEASKLFERDPNQPERRYVEVHGVEAGSDELAVRQVLSILAGQLLTTHRANAHIVNMVGAHIAEQLIQLGMTHFKQGDIKLNGFLETHRGLIQTERLWTLGNPGTSKLTLRKTLVTEQTGPGTRTTHLIGLNEHQIYGVDGKYQNPLNGNDGSGMMNASPWTPGQQQQLMTMQVQGQPNQQFGHPLMAMGYHQMNNMQPQFGGMGPNFPQNTHSLHQHVKDYPNGFFSATSEEQITEMNNALYNGMGLSADKENQQVPAVNNRSLTESDLGPRDESTPIKGKIEQIEVMPVLITDDAVEVSEDRFNAYGVYRRERSGKVALAVSVGDFLTAQEALDEAYRLRDKYDVNLLNGLPVSKAHQE